ncbi:MAG: glycosyltransferase [Lachnospiraceae bacterium]|nr:glycosyltransferase [Lachnospiraceae bacterium]
MAKKIKIALFIRGFHNGGIEKVFESYFTHMDLSPFEIHVITHMPNIPEKKKMFEDMGCVIHELSRVHGHKLNRRNFKEYRELFSSVRFDIVHNNMPENLLPFLYAKRYKIPVRILHAHNIYTEGYDKKKPVVRKLFMIGFALNTRNATQLVAVSNAAAVSAFGKQPEGKVLILPNAIEMGKFRFRPDVRAEYRQKLGVGDDFVIGYIGRYETDQKNQEFVLEIFRDLLEKKSNSRLLMIGDGKRLDFFKKMACDMGISRKVIFTGNVQNVQDYLQVMDVFILPSRKEGLGIVAVEAQASGLYCVLSDKVPEEAKVSENVTFLPIGEENHTKWVQEIIKHYQDERKDNTEDIIKAGYNIETAAEQLELMYKGIL